MSDDLQSKDFLARMAEEAEKQKKDGANYNGATNHALPNIQVTAGERHLEPISLGNTPSDPHL